ncbi:MAG: LysR family transcriptional regulator [Humidesulfovibrio sp.]|uniref:LysR family transcriptional regulator n=1 Tax=Humidesulfovibrio sp. TaxID=2910988 RepID=UPI0027FB8928|nr:LysR family transcriptional regulator [Humidesulfovibrio sp.]MDQ7835825.1 LysR family transcriptional regulator [Humidesulfovibrio sp.]
MLDPHLLRSFLAVAAELSFRKAALALHCAPSTVTSQIRSLEQELGVVLFERSSRSVRLTGSGQGLVQNARRIVDLIEETQRLAAGGDGSGLELAVRISESLGVYCLPWVLPRFRQRFPDIRLSFATHSRHGLHQDIQHGVMDLALLLGEPFLAAGIDVELLGRERLVAIVAPQSPLAGSCTLRPEMLDAQALVLTRHVWSLRRSIEAALLEARVRPASVVECASVELVKACVMAGQGLSIVPAFSVREAVRRGELATLEWHGEGLFAPVYLARQAERMLSPVAEAFSETLRAFFRRPEKNEAISPSRGV